jgi:hypothetical protein
MNFLPQNQQHSTFYKKYFIVLFVLLSFSDKVLCQHYPQKYFSKPIDPPYKLAGNFGEIRADHFHSGIDFSTSEEEGKNVYAAAAGYISRIKISSVGFGKAIYITHRNGYVTVYGHLKSFYPALEKYVHDRQYEKESFEIELFPGPKEFVVKKGQVIAYSGNTGSSSGPHLHFEIRDEKTEEPINPQLFGYKIPDKVKPEITLLKVIPKRNEGIVISGDSANEIKVMKKGEGKFSINSNETIKAFGKAGFEFAMADFQKEKEATIGIYSMQLKVDTTVIYSYKYRRFNFNETRYINSHIDYAEKVKDGVTLERCFHQGRNPLKFYKDTMGFYNFNQNRKYKITATVKDFNGNTSGLEFFVKGDSSLKEEPKLLSPEFTTVAPETGTIIRQPDFIISIPPMALYDTCYFSYKVESQQQGFYSPDYIIGDKTVPLQLGMSLNFKPTGLTEALKNKAVIVSKTEKGEVIAEGGSWSGEFISTRTRHFGRFAIALDTISPAIVIRELPDIASAKALIQVKITDNLSGIKSYRAVVDGKWHLMEYDAKNDMLSGQMETPSINSTHTFEIEVIDVAGNKSTARQEFTF